MPSVYEIITDRIIMQLESGVAPWRKPWTCQTPANLVTQKEYERWDAGGDPQQLSAELKAVLSKIAYLRTLIRDVDRELENLKAA